MKIRPYSHFRRHGVTGITLGILVFLTGWIASVPGYAQGEKEGGKSDPIRITADKLVTDNTKRSAQFSGNVRAVQGNTVMTADRLTIFYKSSAGSSSESSGNSIERLKAEGHVRIEFDNKVAVSNQADYIIAERKLILSGPGSKVVSGQDEVSGSKITFFRDDGRVALEGDDQHRVNAIIHSDQGGLN